MGPAKVVLPRGALKRYAGSLSLLMRIADAVACIAAAMLAYLLRFGSLDFVQNSPYPLIVLVSALLLIIVFPMMGLYRSWRAQRLLAPTSRALFAWIVVFMLLFVLLVAFKQSERISRTWLATWFGLQAMFLMALRLIVHGGLLELRRRGFNRRDVVVIGSGPQALFLVQQIRESLGSGLAVAGVFDNSGGSAELDGHPVQPLAALRPFLARHPVDEVWITLPLEESRELRGVLSQLRDCVANVRYAPDLQDLYLLNRGVTEMLGTPMIDLMTSPIQGSSRLLKELEDRLLAAIIVVVISPLMVLIALGVKLSSPGPVFYRQERTGWGGRSFMMLKFRSMRLNAEVKTGAVWASKGDVRVTPFGAFLRHTSLDELPQFLNVLKGDMSIVGPRPERPVFVQRFRSEIYNYMPRHLVKAGITGWAQVNGWRGNTDLNKRVEHDLYYIENWSLWFDIKIIGLTLFKGFVNKNAY